MAAYIVKKPNLLKLTIQMAQYDKVIIDEMTEVPSTGIAFLGVLTQKVRQYFYI